MTPVLQKQVSGPIAWVADTLLPNDGLVAVPTDVLAEIEALAEFLQGNPLPTEALRLDDFDLPACQAFMTRVREILDHGVGFAIIDHLPLDDLGTGTATKVYWLLMSMLGLPVAQKWDGTLVYDITDTGLKTEAGNGVRSSVTNDRQGYHTDNSFGVPPEFVALLCLRPAMEGGVSGLISFQSVHNLLLTEQPDLLSRLYQPFHFDRQLEHAPGDDLLVDKPIFTSDGETVAVTLSPRLVRQGYAVAGIEMDGETIAAMEALREVAERPGLAKNFDFEPGQIQIINNRRLGHRRSAYSDWTEPGRKRHLVRMWLRNSGRAFYHG